LAAASPRGDRVVFVVKGRRAHPGELLLTGVSGAASATGWLATCMGSVYSDRVVATGREAVRPRTAAELDGLGSLLLLGYGPRGDALGMALKRRALTVREGGAASRALPGALAAKGPQGHGGVGSC